MSVAYPARTVAAIGVTHGPQLGWLRAPVALKKAAACARGEKDSCRGSSRPLTLASHTTTIATGCWPCLATSHERSRASPVHRKPSLAASPPSRSVAPRSGEMSHLFGAASARSSPQASALPLRRGVLTASQLPHVAATSLL
jgi:hypothetical protein